MSNSYKTILRSTSIIGGSQAINYLVSMLRTKVVAVLLGPSGVGLVGIYISTIAMIRTLSGLGIDSSGVRQVARVHGEEDKTSIANTVTALRRICWITGILGWTLAAVFSWPLSKWALDDTKHAGTIALLGATILLSAISGGQNSIIQGVRRIGDLARIQVSSSVVNAVVALLLYSWLREDGIVPVILVTAVIQVFICWHFARKIQIESIDQTWRETFRHGKALFSLGFGFLWSALLGLIVDLAIRSFLIREYGMEANGFYQAAWALTGMASGFILGAMASDFSPHLTSLIHDHVRANNLVNEQSEIALLLGLPALLGMLTLAPWLIEIFYSSKFHVSAEILPWFIAGTFIRLFSWPLGFILVAKGASRWFMLTQTQYHVIHVLLVHLLVPRFGLVAAGFSFAVTFLPGLLLNLLIVRKLTGFKWTFEVRRLIFISSLVVVSGFLLSRFAPLMWSTMIGTLMTITTGIFCIRGLTTRVGKQSRLVMLAYRVPCLKLILPKID